MLRFRATEHAGQVAVAKLAILVHRTHKDLPMLTHVGTRIPDAKRLTCPTIRRAGKVMFDLSGSNLMKSNRNSLLNKDAYGRMIWAHFNGKPSLEVIERDDGRVDVGSSEVYFRAFKKWPKCQRQAVKFARGRVLDIGAGAGRVALYLQCRGFKTTAIDSSPLAIKVCKKRGIKDARLLSVERIEKLAPLAFDTVVMYGNNFGLLGSQSKGRAVLAKLQRITTRSAIIIAESMDPYKTAELFDLSYQRLNQRRRKMRGQTRIRVRFMNYVGAWINYLFVSKKEMKNILKGTGWKVSQFMDSEDSHYIAVIEKERSSISGTRTTRRTSGRWD